MTKTWLYRLGRRFGLHAGVDRDASWALAEDAPLYAELFSADQMALHGKALAGMHRMAPAGAPDQLLARLSDNENTLVEVCRLLTDAVTENRRITPAGVWLLDNFYLIEEQISTAKRHLPKGYSRELPRLSHGPSAGRPRVYDIALETIAHGDGRVDTESLSRFVAAYQTITSLNLGELWAIPIMLRLAVIENLRRVGTRIAAGLVEHSMADSWADQMTEVAEHDPKSLILVIADMARSNPPMGSAFVAELARRLQGRGPALALPLTWIEQRLSESGLTIEQRVQEENQRQAADQVSISNSIGSLRVMGAMDWREFVETMSVVDQTLRGDPSGVYGQMDFATRDHYRHAIEKLARKSRLSEGEVARKAVELARGGAAAAANGGADEREGHVGYYLIGNGQGQIELAARPRHGPIDCVRRAAGRMPLSLYLGAITLITTTFAAALLALASTAEPGTGLSGWGLVAMAIPALLAASQLAVALVNWFATLLVTAQPLPRMDFSLGIPTELRTLVVVPTMLTGADSIEDLVEALEVRFLANRDPNLHFGLLTDFLDAPHAVLPGDAALEQLAHTRIDELNRKYRSGSGGDIFFLFHRARSWNPQERVWMGYERKRGKLAALNALLRGHDPDAAGKRFARVVGDYAILRNVKYVITLDTDTQLPRDVARQFVGAMAHPLNRPRYDEMKLRVVDGYGILQPRVAVSLPGTNRSRYARLYGGEPGLDPYTRAVSDVYQDVFGEGSFVGKGIYDVDAFEQSLGERFPENRILSHDLIEGCYARSGLLSDVQLFEDFPTRYSADVSRRRRWMRGDWQLAGWLLPRVPCACTRGAGAGTHDRLNVPAAHLASNPLSALSRWKLADNLRRSLVPPSLLLLLVLGWTVLGQPWIWTLGVIAILVLPAVFTSTLELVRKPVEVRLQQHLAAVGRTVARHLSQLAFEFACLPYEVLLSLDAIGRTGWRMWVSRRRLLEWNPSSEVDRELAARSDLFAALRSMWAGPATALACAAYLLSTRPEALIVAAPLLLLWLGSPVIAWWLSRPLAPRTASLSLEQTHFLRMLARRTWAFFETYVGPADHWLPPDNCQAYRVVSVAHRTSPTNIGMALLAGQAAYDFGYLSAGALLERTANTLGTMHGLERYRGHFYNWYDTETLQPLPPLYVSTVDSGNLAGHLLTLRAGLLALADEPIVAPRLFIGMDDTLRVFAAALAATKGSAEGATDVATAAALRLVRAELDAVLAAPPRTVAAVHAALLRLADAVASLVPAAAARLLVKDDLGSDSETQFWAHALLRHCRAALDDLAVLAPWLAMAPPPPGLEAIAGLNRIPTVRELVRTEAALDADFDPHLGAGLIPEHHAWLSALRHQLGLASVRARERIAAIDGLAAQCSALAHMEYDFLYDSSRQLLVIGYNVTEGRADASYYDLLASEARLSSFVAIAQGEVPQQNWFALGRLLTSVGGDTALLSWSGSMFEYLMPLLVMPTYDNTLLDQTCKAAVARQIEYGRQRGVPWGISESGYNTVDVHLNYQYRAFGVPGLGLKRGLADDLVIAPYASVMALMVAPDEACENLQRLAGDGFMGQFGFFEAIDYTPARQRRGQKQVVVRSFMAHHQGMSLLALAYQLLDRPMQARFESDRRFQAVMLLLQERIPKTSVLFSQTVQRLAVHSTTDEAELLIRVFDSPDTATPEVQLLSNGRYHVMLTNAGGGYSRWRDLAVTRWREDGTCDNRGSFCYVRDRDSGVFWSTAHQPALRPAQAYEAIFSEGRAEFRRRDAIGTGADAGYIDTYTEIVVSPEDDIELRRVRLTNRSRQRREIELTSYAEVVIAPADADALHPAFSNLFVQTEIIPARHAILCMRRPRSAGERSPWMLHLMIAHGAQASAMSYETDRARFIGRTRDVADPFAMDVGGALSGQAGAVLDPIVAIRAVVSLEPEQSVTIDIVTGIAENRELAECLIDKYQDRHLADRVFDLAWTHGQVMLRQLNATEADAQLYARLASTVIHANASLRPDPALLVKNRRGQSGLWGYAISGDLPIVLLQIGDSSHIDLVRQLVQAHAYWRIKGLAVDLVIWNEDHAGYRQRLQDQIMGMITSGIEASVIDRPGGIFVRPAEQISNEDRILLQAVARVVITDRRGTLEEQLDHLRLADPRPPPLVPSRALQREPAALAPAPLALILTNGVGGFSADGREYVMTLAPGAVTPAPWSNVLANPSFGTVISESGSAYTWGENAHEFRLTPWHNDPVSDAGGEAIYLRDEDSGQLWSPTALPVRSALHYRVRHGFGYSVFETCCSGIHSELWIYVAVDAALKFSVLKVRNESGRARRLTATGYVEWVLGDLPAKTAMHLNTEIDPRSGALFARNPYSNEFAERVAFFDVDGPTRNVSGDRTEFLGRNGNHANPAALRRARLSGKVGAALDPCGAIQVGVDLADGEAHEVVFRLGFGRDTDDAAALVQRFRGGLAARNELDAVYRHWRQTLGAVRVETPDPAFDVLANGWLVYQNLACRVWARSGYYQSGGAYGFRDQLQDLMALVHAEPARVRAHLLLCASRQFVEGDVQHWWHPPAGRGVRTRCSDDYLWLPLAVCRYLTATTDRAVLDEDVHFLEGRAVPAHDDSYYDLPARSAASASLYQHCVRAIRHGLRFGEHGLPLMGSGDWNDGMNLVGIEGRGESVWLGFFLCEVLRQFEGVAAAFGDHTFAATCGEERQRLRENLEHHGWDGAWYRRAYFDDGTALGSAGAEECRIDSIAQSWAVLSGVGEAARVRQAMDAAYTHLAHPDQGLMQLLDPPFDRSSLDPGYIRGYVPGVRENGGQYTHAAIWAAMAFAALGERERAWALMTMINPVNHARTAAGVATYKVEPYVVAADVYALSPYLGRGGWSWYTGSAGWMYRLMLESLLGLRREGDTLQLAPCLPAHWPGFTLHYRYRDTMYYITVSQTAVAADADGTEGGTAGDGEAAGATSSTLGGVTQVSVDGVVRDSAVIALVDDLVDHQVAISLTAVASAGAAAMR